MLGVSALALGLAACGGASDDFASTDEIADIAAAAPGRAASSKLPQKVLDRNRSSTQEAVVADSGSTADSGATTVQTAEVLLGQLDGSSESATTENSESTLEAPLVPVSASFGSSSLPIQSLKSDMTDPHEMLMHGINPDWGWGSRPRIGRGNSVPADWTSPAFVPWGIVAASTNGSLATNARVQIRKMTADFKYNGRWQRIDYSSTNSELMGAVYTDYETNASVAADLRDHGADGISVRLPQSGGSFHFMTRSRFPITSAGIQGVVVKFEARLVVDDPNRTDDRALAKLLALSGGDYWRSMSAQWNPSTYSNDDFAIGRARLLSNEWTTITSHSLSSDDEISNYISAEASLSQS